MKKKYLFFDIDGTLAAGGYGNTYIPESCQEALKRLREAGHFLALCTGRSHAMAEEFLGELGFEHMVSDGGYGITLNGQLRSITPLVRENVIALVEECREKGIPWALQTENSKVRYAPDERFYDYTHDTYMKTEVLPGLDPENYPVLYKAYAACYFPDEFKIEALKDLPWCRFHKEYIFIEPCNKAEGIKKMLKEVGGEVSDVIVFGDSRNDLSMFIDEWTCVAMGNACDELKEKADLITTDADKDGIWNACQTLGLF
ncbi:MAG: HAD-IIB family hydrolase [Solobacterium sp.]|nr:HAD-IIB family hydrolase [Solobacterium sp.]